MNLFNNNVTIPFYYLLYLLKIKKYGQKTIHIHFFSFTGNFFFLCF